VAACPGFVAPSYTRPSTAPVLEAVSPGGKQLFGPFADRGMSGKELEEEWARIRTADSSLNMEGAMKVFAELHPEVFLSREEVLALGAPLDAPAPRPPWRAEMIGSTTLPAAGEEAA
jgi:hypothetical protein